LTSACAAAAAAALLAASSAQVKNLLHATNRDDKGGQIDAVDKHAHNPILVIISKYSKHNLSSTLAAMATTLVNIEMYVRHYSFQLKVQLLNCVALV
jgi:hypothetical protein